MGRNGFKRYTTSKEIFRLSQYKEHGGNSKSTLPFLFPSHEPLYHTHIPINMSGTFVLKKLKKMCLEHVTARNMS